MHISTEIIINVDINRVINEFEERTMLTCRCKVHPHCYILNSGLHGYTYFSLHFCSSHPYTISYHLSFVKTIKHKCRIIHGSQYLLTNSRYGGESLKSDKLTTLF